MSATYSFRFHRKEVKIFVDHGLLSEVGEFISSYDPFRVVIITDTTVADLYAKKVMEEIERQGIRTQLFTFSPGEKKKARKIVWWIENEMLGFATADSAVVGIGGGVVLDVAGYVAAEFFREKLLFFAIPTTLMGMHDAAIGAKNAVNSERGKHSFGVYYAPEFVLCDLDTLSTLPERELKSGIVESVKHALCQDLSFLSTIARRDYDEIVRRTIELKLECMKEDEEEKFTPILHVGHTLGHQIEFQSLHSTDTLTHGEALSHGIKCEALLSHKLGILSEEDCRKVLEIFENLSLNFPLPPLNIQKIVEGLQYDNKRTRRGAPFFLLTSLGEKPKVVWEDEIPREVLLDSLQTYEKIARMHARENRHLAYLSEMVV